MRRFSAACFLFLTVACGDAPRNDSPARPAEKSAAATPAANACDHLPKPAVETILGGAARGPIREGGAANLDQCQYIHDGERVIDVRTATVQRLPADLATMRGSLGEFGDGVEEVAGLGAPAIWIPEMGAVYVGDGGRTLSFSVTAPDIDTKAKSIALARAGLPRPQPQ